MTDLIRIIEGNAEPHARFWSWTPRPEGAANAAAELRLYGPISEYSWWGDEVTPAKFASDLAKFGSGGPVMVRIHSGGGDIFAASAIRAMLTDYAGPVTCRIDGLCASAAVAIALAGDTVEIHDSAYMMIHQPSYRVLIGNLNAARMRKLSENLDLVAQSLVGIYAARTGMEPAEIGALMDAETWYTAQTAVDSGFADAIIKGGLPKDLPSVQNMIPITANTPAVLLEPAEALSPPRLSESAALSDEAARLRQRVRNITQKYNQKEKTV